MKPDVTFDMPVHILANRSILVVEDDQGLREEICQYLEGRAMRVTSAADLRGARAQLACHRFDLVLLDLWLGAESGVDLLRDLRGATRTPCIIMTAQDGVKAALTGAALGADDCILKPFHPRDLMASLSSALTSRRAP